MKWLRQVTCLALAICCGCAVKPVPKPLETTLRAGAFLTAPGQELTEAETTRLGLDKDFLLIGEGHANPCDHAVQARLLKNLALAGHKFAIGLEMLPVTAQSVLDDFNARRITAEQLEHESNWSKNWGHPYAQYLPIFQVAETHDLPVAALNIPRPIMTKLRDEGTNALSADEHAQSPNQIITASAQQKKALQQQINLHQALRKPAASDQKKSVTPQEAERFFLVQAIWDSMMAEQALAWHEKLNLPLVILAGAGHVEHGWGIEYRLRLLSPQARILAVMPVRDENDFLNQSDPQQRAQTGEMIFFACAAQHRSRLGMVTVFKNNALRVAEVTADSTAAQAGLMPGDILVAAGETLLTKAMDLHFAAMAALRQKRPLELTVQRGETTQTLTLPLH